MITDLMMVGMWVVGWLIDLKGSQEKYESPKKVFSRYQVLVKGRLYE